MKKLILAVVLVLGLSLTAQAEPLKIGDVIQKLPPLKAGVGFSLIDNKINHLETFVLLEKNGFTLEGGYAGDADKTDSKIVGVASYQLLKLKNYVNIPVLDLIEFNPGLYVGFGSINIHRVMESEMDWGISASLISLKF